MSKVRWNRVGIAISIGAVVMPFGIVGAAEAMHRYRVYQAGGNWCVRAGTDGSIQRLYGDDCGVW